MFFFLKWYHSVDKERMFEKCPPFFKSHENFMSGISRHVDSKNAILNYCINIMLRATLVHECFYIHT